MLQDRNKFAGNKAAGFTLFEMVVVICSIVILYMVAEQRLNELPAAAERANFMAVLEQIKTGVNFAMISKMTQGKTQDLHEMDGSNPMAFLLEGPSNYLGELQLVTDTIRRRNAWYFESSTGDLVYVVGGASIGDVWIKIAAVPVNYGQIRFRIKNIYSGMDAGKVGENLPAERNSNQDWQGMLLVPVHEYSWEKGQETPVEI